MQYRAMTLTGISKIFFSVAKGPLGTVHFLGGMGWGGGLGDLMGSSLIYNDPSSSLQFFPCPLVVLNIWDSPPPHPKKK